MPSLTLSMAAAHFIFRLKGNKYLESAMRGVRPASLGMLAAARRDPGPYHLPSGRKNCLEFCGNCPDYGSDSHKGQTFHTKDYFDCRGSGADFRVEGQS